MAINDYTTYTYTGSVQTATLLAGITYKLECWGAKGRAGYRKGTTFNNGGNGGYAVGEYTPSVDTDINIYVGNGVTRSTAGGYNGGGNGTVYGTYENGGGGGASDIRVGGTALANRIIVGAGGGGSGSYGSYSGGAGGGSTGSTAIGSVGGTGGTQSAGGTLSGALGVGGAGSAGGGGGGGGGGYYGGGGGAGIYDGGGGGSSYLGSLANASTTSGANTGDGVVKITELTDGSAQASFSFAQII